MQNEITEAMIQAAARANIHPSTEPSSTELRYARRSLEAVAALTQAAEPVAWHIPGEQAVTKDRDVTDRWRLGNPRAKIEPLYTSPPVASPEPEGWVLVPMEPTFEMAKAAIHLDPKSDLDAKYRAMLSARPTPPCDGRAEALEWQPIETAPKDGTEILVTRHPMSMQVVVSWREGMIGDFSTGWKGCRWRSDAGRVIEPTHWMLLPHLPRALTQKDKADD